MLRRKNSVITNCYVWLANNFIFLSHILNDGQSNSHVVILSFGNYDQFNPVVIELCGMFEDMHEKVGFFIFKILFQ